MIPQEPATAPCWRARPRLATKACRSRPDAVPPDGPICHRRRRICRRKLKRRKGQCHSCQDPLSASVHRTCS